MDISLTQHLDERLRWIASPEGTANAKPRRAPGEFVLYWMHNALRTHENPALDAAICFARQNGLPLLVYHGLSEHYPFASDRHHAFMLQGHRDVQRQLHDRGISAAFHLQRQGKRGPYLRDLARSAACLVTEEMPVQPLTGWMERLAATVPTPIATVDCTCLAPVTVVNKPFTSASDFRRHCRTLYEERIGLEYPEQGLDEVPMCDIESITERLKLRPLCLQDANLAELIGECRIDHSIAPVAHSPGGTRAGYRRWEAYKEKSLKRYDRARNDPNDRDGSSRMSAYLHYGMVSPFRIAREADALGAKKYLDELLTWRELAFHFCYHNRDIIDTLDAVPDWAKETLAEHGEDQRQADCSWETLARGRTGRPLWDTAQRSLVKHGELHNHLRMTWGKSFLPRLKSPTRALQLTLDLNHRYSLDGRNPSSYGGVLWCYGQFDDPVEPAQPIIGKIRPRDDESQAKKIDLHRLTRHVDRPIASQLPRVAVVGAGIGGLAAARTLADHGLDVMVFDKSRGVGGRTSTRHAQSSIDGDEVTFDHGAQYFTARDARFCRMVNSWIHDQIVTPWMGRIVSLDSTGEILEEKSDTPRYVGVPGMNAVAKHLAKGLTLRLGTPVTGLSRTAGRWEIENGDGQKHGPFDIVLCNCPPKQTFDLIGGHSELGATVRSVRMRPCWAMMVAAESLSGIEYDAAFVGDHDISWIAANHAKPGRSGDAMAAKPSWVIHASAEWSDANVDRTREQVIDHLLPQTAELLGRNIKATDYLTAHRWRYAIPEKPLDHDHLFDSVDGIGVCGDWCGGSRVEAAYLSGIALAGSLLRHHTIDRPAYDPANARQPSLFA